MHDRRRGTGDEEPLIHQIGDAVDFVANEVERLRLVSRFFAGEEIGVHADRGGGVVDLVRETGRDAPESSETLGLASQLLLFAE